MNRASPAIPLASAQLQEFAGIAVAEDADPGRPPTEPATTLASFTHCQWRLHFGGLPVKAGWVVLGLAPPTLFVTGFLMWWNRVGSKKWKKLTGSESKASSSAPAGTAAPAPVPEETKP